MNKDLLDELSSIVGSNKVSVETLAGKRRVFGDIVGSVNFSTEPEVLDAYASDLSFVPKNRPHAVVWPSTTEEVQEIVRWANRRGIPLIPVSSGPPHFRGDTVPVMGGVVVDLSRMNRIVRIDRRNRVTVIEPGVTFAQLQPELAKEGLRLITPLRPRATKSVLGSILEREPGIAPRYQYDISDPLCCLEVVFGTGELFRTGEAAGPGGREAQWKIGGAQKFPLGPHQVDYHRLVQGAQGTIGIATWASVKCELLPSLRKLYFVPAEKLADLVDFTYRIIRLTLGEEIFIVNRFTLSSLVGGTAEEIKALSEGLPSWILIVCLNGFERHPQERLAYQEEDMFREAQYCGVKPVTAIGAVGSGQLVKALQDLSAETPWKLKFKGGSHDIFFITTLEKSSRFPRVVAEAAEAAGYPANEIGVYVQPVVQGTSCHMEFQFPCDPANPREVTRLKDLFHSATRALLKEGAFFSRPYPLWAEEVYRERADYVAALKRVKKIFDPNHVLNPGKLCFCGGEL